MSKYCCNCKYWTWNNESEEWQCWRDDSANSGVPMDDFDSCNAYLGNGEYGFEPINIKF